MTDNEFNMIMESLVERYNNGEITYEEASKVEDKVRANYAKDKAAKKAAKQQKLENRVNDAVGKKIYKQSTKYANKYNNLENKKNEICNKAVKLNARMHKDRASITDKDHQTMVNYAKQYNDLIDKQSNIMAASKKYNDKVKQRGENRKLKGSMGTKNYLAAKANQAKNSAAGAVSTGVHNVLAAKNKLFKAHESAMNDFDKTRLEVFEAYENGVINEAEKYELLNTLESAGEFGDYPTEDMLYKDAQPEKIFSQVEDRQAINNPIFALNNNAASSYDDTTAINPEFDDYSVKAADKEIITKESVKLDIFDAYEAGEITEADKYELLAMVD
jgi:hypothetical protein